MPSPSPPPSDALGQMRVMGGGPCHVAEVTALCQRTAMALDKAKLCAALQKAIPEADPATTREVIEVIRAEEDLKVFTSASLQPQGIISPDFTRDTLAQSHPDPSGCTSDWFPLEQSPGYLGDHSHSLGLPALAELVEAGYFATPR